MSQTFIHIFLYKFFLYINLSSTKLCTFTFFPFVLAYTAVRQIVKDILTRPRPSRSMELVIALLSYTEKVMLIIVSSERLLFFEIILCLQQKMLLTSFKMCLVPCCGIKRTPGFLAGGKFT